MELSVKLVDKKYSIYIEKGLFQNILQYIHPVFDGKKIMIISDDLVFPLYGKNIEEQLQSCYEVNHIIIEHGEKAKSFENLLPLYQRLIEYHMTRSDLIIALGGGVVGDLAGFVASTYLRGIELIQIPTSLLAQVDSSVGGKVAIDLQEGKNLVGAFKHPLMVLIDPTSLKTLQQRFISDGMAEVIKYGCILDSNLFDKLNSYENFEDLYQDIDNIIYRCIDLKRQVVEEDVYDLGKRMLLNFGHTLGHAIEQFYHYERYTHGEAVAIGMVQITHIAQMYGLTEKGTSKKIIELLKKYHLPMKADIPIEKLKNALLTDKKNFGQTLSYILLKDIGNSYIYSSDIHFVDKVEEI